VGEEDREGHRVIVLQGLGAMAPREQLWSSATTRATQYFASALQAARQNDAAGLSTDVVGVIFEQQSAAPDITEASR
jgi:hypothetical protein